MSGEIKALYLLFLAVAVGLGAGVGWFAARRLNRWFGLGGALLGAGLFLFGQIEADTDPRFFLLSACGLGVMTAGVLFAIAAARKRPAGTTDLFSTSAAPPARKP